MPAPDTVTEAVELLQSLGYADSFDLATEARRGSSEASMLGIETAVVDHTFRFEGDSDLATRPSCWGCPARRGTARASWCRPTGQTSTSTTPAS
jgi:hypothetical protein